MILSKIDQEIIKRAIQRIENGLTHYSCVAIRNAGYDLGYYMSCGTTNHPLVIKYAKFYEKDIHQPWYRSADKAYRATALCLFLAAGSYRNETN